MKKDCLTWEETPLGRFVAEQEFYNRNQVDKFKYREILKKGRQRIKNLRAINSSVRRIEKDVTFDLFTIEGGDFEVSVPVGRIDLLTDKEIIEVKVYPEWKNAIGQVKSYGKFFPEKSLRVHLFNTPEKGIPNYIKEVFIEEDIRLTHDFQPL